MCTILPSGPALCPRLKNNKGSWPQRVAPPFYIKPFSILVFSHQNCNSAHFNKPYRIFQTSLSLTTMSSTRRITRNSPSKPGSSQKWRSASLVDSYSDNSSDGTLCDTEIQIDDLDEACSITFKVSCIRAIFLN
jgi:hypothetical protein